MVSPHSLFRQQVFIGIGTVGCEMRTRLACRFILSMRRHVVFCFFDVREFHHHLSFVRLFELGFESTDRLTQSRTLKSSVPDIQSIQKDPFMCATENSKTII
mmetsp:Transcript_17041/g.39195  ORF Transcript_17041/g.39195 Transcript_17041/m.39195 type:complete len:102 (+) Transcript_17041:145-450(+)